MQSTAIRPECIDDLLKPREAAAYLSVTVRTLTNWTRQGLRGVRLRVVAIGGRNRFRRPDIDEFLHEVARRRGLVAGRGVLAMRKDQECAEAAARAQGLTW